MSHTDCPLQPSCSNSLSFMVVLLLQVIILPACSTQSAFGDENAGITVFPVRIQLDALTTGQQLVITRNTDGRSEDLSHSATYRSQDTNVARVDEQGLVTAISNGASSIAVIVDGQVSQVPVVVSGFDQPVVPDFEQDILPVFARAGCNAGACHGKARGQNGFQLSLLGFDPEFDYNSLRKEARGRRIFLPDPSQSVLMMKPTGEMPHGGGVRLKKGSTEYQLLLSWLGAGMPRSKPGTPSLVSVSVYPEQCVMQRDETQQLAITAHYSDGITRDVTRLAAYQSNESVIASVDEHGIVHAGQVTGEAAIMARYEGMIAVSSIAVPMPGDVPAELYAKLPTQNFIDGFVWEKLQRLGITPSPPCDDATFLRRVYIDIIGRLPSPEECRAFLSDTTTNKRSVLIDHLLEQPEFADHWANKWADLLRPNPYRVGLKTVLNYDNWIRDSFRKNKPYDEFVRELITARGSTFKHGHVTLFRDRRTPEELTTMVSQLFLGIRLECARCHHHPFEKWGQDDFYSFAAYFAKIARKGTGLSPPISGSEEIVYSTDRGSVTHPLTGEVLEPRPLFGEAPQIAEGEDPRVALAEWITSDDNPYFAQVMCNRVWADLMGRGLVEPVDDIRATNPATNQELLTALGEDFRDNGYDLKHLVRRITNSYIYGLSSLPTERNLEDQRYYSRYYRQRLRAEVLLDSVAAITKVPEDYSAMPPGAQAKQIWTHRIGSLFLDAFGRPDPNQDPPCERTSDTTVVQVLHLMNAENLFSKVTSDKGKIAELANSDLETSKIVEELYLMVYARFPDNEERKYAESLFEKEGTERRQVAEDLLWAMMNTPEFVFKN